MKKSKLKLYLFRLLLFLIIIIGFEVIGYTVLWWNSNSYDLIWNRNYFRVRAMLMGNTDGTQFPRYLTLPYLGHIPFPGYIKDNELQHNEDGYRGHKVPLVKTDKFRVLCMGGSTTYGLGVKFPSETYPAQLEMLLGNYFRNDSILSKKYNGVEVLNAGIEAGTSAEELQQYLFKYRYYQSDVVIVHSGLNDAEVMSTSTSDFQLDYTHYRRFQFHLESLPIPARWLMKSYLVSFLTIQLFYENFNYFGASGTECYTKQRGQTFCRWTDLNMDVVFKNKQYQYLPFYRNTKTLFEEIIKDSAALIVLPTILNPQDKVVQSRPDFFHLCSENAALSKLLAMETGGVDVPFTFDSIKTSSWIDDCHLNSSGEKNKAQIVLPYVVQAAQQKAVFITPKN